MIPKFLTSILTLFLLACGAPKKGSEKNLYVQFEVIENALDGTQRRGCGEQYSIYDGQKKEMWFIFGSARYHDKKPWEAAVTRNHCGQGGFEETRSQVGRIFGTPYLILDLQTTPSLLASGNLSLKLSLIFKKLSGFDKKKVPIYDTREETRVFELGSEGEMVLPLLIMDPREKEEFGVFEVLLLLKTWVIGAKPPAEYGTILIKADVPGAEVIMDGGFVGRVLEGGPLEIRNVLVGKREIRVRDFSGREASKTISVRPGRGAEVDLQVLPNSIWGGKKELLPLGKNPHGFEEFWRERDKAIVVKVPAGEFLMGSKEGEGEPNERPQHRVFVSEFFMDKTEVTWRQYKKFSGSSGSPLPPFPVWGSPDDYSVSNLTWEEAQAYCEWIGGRLPTEAEWEKAARGPDGRKYPWGMDWDPDRCNSLDGGPHRPEAVGSFPNCISPYGILDMAGGVWEWCADWYTDQYPGELVKDPKGPAIGNQRVMRGACWHNMSTWLRTAYRKKSDPFWRNPQHGFRCVRKG